MLSFEWPWLLLLLPMPFLVRRFAQPIETGNVALRVPFLKRLHTNTSNAPIHSLSSLRAYLLLGAWLFLLVAGMRPVTIGDAIPIKKTGRDLLLAVDISESMARRDMTIDNQRVPRLIAVKVILNDFLKKRKGDQIGLILFGTNAYLQAPLTFDIDTVAEFLIDAQIGLAGERTAIGDAIGLGVKRLHERPESQRVMILLTDGENTAGNLSPYESIDLAKEAQVKIYTVAVGPSVFSNVDERMLTNIASATGGEFFNARNSTELAAIYDYIDNIEQIENEEQFYRPTKPWFRIPLAISFILLCSVSLAGVSPFSLTRRTENS
jgi:Ca-activated chloride channel family protein